MASGLGWPRCCSSDKKQSSKPQALLTTGYQLSLTTACVPHLQIHTLLGLDNADELCWHHTALVDQLVEGVLAIGTWLTKVNLTSFKWHAGAIQANPLAVALHGHLHTQPNTSVLFKTGLFVQVSTSHCLS